jgi:hypothetical protein
MTDNKNFIIGGLTIAVIYLLWKHKNKTVIENNLEYKFLKPNAWLVSDFAYAGSDTIPENSRATIQSKYPIKVEVSKPDPITNLSRGNLYFYTNADQLKNDTISNIPFNF